MVNSVAVFLFYSERYNNAFITAMGGAPAAPAAIAAHPTLRYVGVGVRRGA